MAFEIRVAALLTEEERKTLLKDGPFAFHKFQNRNDRVTEIKMELGYDHPKETSKKRQLSELLQSQKVFNASWSYSEDLVYFNVSFNVYGSEKMDEIMEDLRFKGFGSFEGSSIHVVESTAFFHDTILQQYGNSDEVEEKQNTFQKFINSVKSRMTVVQIYQSVKDRGNITFDYVCFLVTAAAIATLSLSTNNYPGIVASMLLSPLMNPILAILFGIILRQKGLINEGLRNLMISVIICITMGFLFGVMCHFINYLEKVVYPTSLMMDRGQYRYILSIILFAVFSAPNLTTALLSNNNSAQIGNAISLSLLPPLANAGFLFFLSLISLFTNTAVFDTNLNKTMCSYKWLSSKHKMLYYDDFCYINLDFALGACFSVLITCVNIAVILIVGFFVFKIKRLASIHLLQEDNRKFYDKDLKEAYTESTMKTLKAKDPNTVMLREMIKEYAEIHHKKVDELTKSEKKIFIGDLKQLTDGFKDDSHFQTITRQMGPTAISNLPSQLHEMEIANRLSIDITENLNINQITTLNNNDRHEYLNMIAKSKFPSSPKTKKFPRGYFYPHKKPDSVGRFEILTTKDVDMNPMPFSNDNKLVKFSINAENI